MTTYVHTGGGVGSGALVVFLHGAGMDHTVWRFQTRRLAYRGWRVLAPDLPGHGRSGGEPCSSVEGWADWLATFLSDRVAADTVVGHSLGALAALEAARRHPGSVGRLVLVGAGIRMPVHPALFDAARHDLPAAARFIAGWSLPPSHLGGHPEPGTWERGTIVRLVEHSPTGVLAADLAASAAYRAEGLDQVRADTLVVSGEFDRMVTGEAARALASGLPFGSHAVLPGSGHQPMVQRPAHFNRLLLDFLDGDGKGSSR